jgi:hypothetical protein
MYNMDETGFGIGSVQDSYIVINKASNIRYQAHPGRQEWINVMEYVCADGGSLMPFVILKGEKLSVSWIPKSALQLNWHFAASAKRWTTNDLGFE